MRDLRTQEGLQETLSRIDHELLKYHGGSLFLDALNKKAPTAGDLLHMESLLPDAAMFLQHHVHYSAQTDEDLDGKCADMVRNFIGLFPKALKEASDDGINLPIHLAARADHKVDLVPLMAEQGIKFGLFNDKERGGLLVQDDLLGCNVLQTLCSKEIGCASNANVTIPHNPACDFECKRVLKKLQEMGLFMTEDVRDHDLLHHYLKSARNAEWGVLLDFLLDCDKDGFQMWRSKDGLSLLMDASSRCLDDFESAVNLAFRLNKVGLLFDQGPNGNTAFSMACQNFGFDKAYNIVVEAGIDWCAEEEWITEIDETTNLYPFMHAATSSTKEDMSFAYHLLRSNPDVMETCASNCMSGSMEAGVLSDSEDEVVESMVFKLPRFKPRTVSESTIQTNGDLWESSSTASLDTIILTSLCKKRKRQ